MVGALILMFIVQLPIPAIDESAANFTPIGAASTLAGEDGCNLAPGWAMLVLFARAATLLTTAVFADRRRDLA